MSVPATTARQRRADATTRPLTGTATRTATRTATGTATRTATIRTAKRPASATAGSKRSARTSSAADVRARLTDSGGRIGLLPDFDPSVRAGLGVFVAMIMGLLTLGMIVLLLLNTALNQGAFELQNLQQEQQKLSDQEQTLIQTVTEQQSPQVLARRAAALGMLPVTSPVFLRLKDGAILGVPLPAVKPKPRPPAPTTTTPTTTTTTATTTTATTTTATTTTAKPATSTPTRTAPTTAATKPSTPVPSPTAKTGTGG